MRENSNWGLEIIAITRSEEPLEVQRKRSMDDYWNDLYGNYLRISRIMNDLYKSSCRETNKMFIDKFTWTVGGIYVCIAIYYDHLVPMLCQRNCKWASGSELQIAQNEDTACDCECNLTLLHFRPEFTHFTWILNVC